MECPIREDFDLVEEIKWLLDGRGCTPDRKKKCFSKSGELLPILCSQCEEKDYSPDPYILTLYNIAILLDAGFPLGPEDLSLGIWLDLGVMRRMIALSCARIF